VAFRQISHSGPAGITPLTFSAVQIRAIPSGATKSERITSLSLSLLTPSSFNLDEILRRRERKRRATFAAQHERAREGSISDAESLADQQQRWKAASFRLHLIGSLWHQQPPGLQYQSDTSSHFHGNVAPTH